MAKRKTTVEDVSESALEQPAPETNALPVADAMEQAVEQLGTVDTPEDAVQASLFPRPPFDHRAALLEISVKEQAVSELAVILDRAKRAHKLAKDDWDEASTELAALIRRHVNAMRESEREPEPHQLSLEGEGCAWERDHPGEVCMVCSQARAALRPTNGETAEQPAAQNDEPVSEGAAATAH